MLLNRGTITKTLRYDCCLRLSNGLRELGISQFELTVVLCALAQFQREHLDQLGGKQLCICGGGETPQCVKESEVK